MPSRLRRAVRALNAEANAVGAELAGGFLELYTAPQPASADTLVTTQTRLARLTFGAPAFQPAINGVAHAHPLTADESAAASGQAAWYRATAANGDPVIDGSVGVVSADCVVNTTEIRQGARVYVTAVSYEARKQA